MVLKKNFISTSCVKLLKKYIYMPKVKKNFVGKRLGFKEKSRTLFLFCFMIIFIYQVQCPEIISLVNLYIFSYKLIFLFCRFWSSAAFQIIFRTKMLNVLNRNKWKSAMKFIFQPPNMFFSKVLRKRNRNVLHNN